MEKEDVRNALVSVGAVTAGAIALPVVLAVGAVAFAARVALLVAAIPLMGFAAVVDAANKKDEPK